MSETIYAELLYPTQNEAPSDFAAQVDSPDFFTPQPAEGSRVIEDLGDFSLRDVIADAQLEAWSAADEENMRFDAKQQDHAAAFIEDKRQTTVYENRHGRRGVGAVGLLALRINPRITTLQEARAAQVSFDTRPYKRDESLERTEETSRRREVSTPRYLANMALEAVEIRATSGAETLRAVTNKLGGFASRLVARLKPAAPQPTNSPALATPAESPYARLDVQARINDMNGQYAMRTNPHTFIGSPYAHAA